MRLSCEVAAHILTSECGYIRQPSAPLTFPALRFTIEVAAWAGGPLGLTVKHGWSLSGACPAAQLVPTQPERDMVIIIERSEEDRVPLRKMLRADLNGARKARDSDLVTLIRTLIAAIDNAEAVEASDAPDGRSEVPRRSLSNDEVVSVVLAEGADLRAAADDYERLGNCPEAERLRALALVADRYADQMPGART